MTLKDLFDSGHARVARGKKEVPKTAVETVTDEGYMKECAALPKGALEKIDFDEMLPSDFKLYWPDSTICCLAVLPFNDGCFGKEEMQTEGKWGSFLKNKSFLRLLMVMPLTKLTSGFGNVGEPAGRYFDFLPDILKKDVSEGGCSFDVRYENALDSGNTKDRAWFIAQCNQALSNLKNFLRF
jgi:hypothetical protein